MSKKATIIAVVNQKGGTGKTTTTENLGVGLALEGKKVLLVDTDPQASLTVSLGNPCPDDLSPTLSDLMGKIMMENPIAPGEGILHHPEGVDLVPSNIELSGMEVALVNAMSRETILRQYLDTVKQNYDYILLDCMPSLGIAKSSLRNTVRKSQFIKRRSKPLTNCRLQSSHLCNHCMRSFISWQSRRNKIMLSTVRSEKRKKNC